VDGKEKCPSRPDFKKPNFHLKKIWDLSRVDGKEKCPSRPDFKKPNFHLKKIWDPVPYGCLFLVFCYFFINFQKIKKIDGIKSKKLKALFYKLLTFSFLKSSKF
jgi:hypothetical protein